MQRRFFNFLILAAISLAMSFSLPAASMIVVTGDHELGFLDLSTGLFSLGGLTASTGIGLGSSVSPSPYLISDETSLYNVNTTSGSTVGIGASGVTLSIGGSLGPDLLYGLDFANNLYQLNAATGLGTLIGPTGLPSIQLTDVFSNALAGDGTNLYYVFEISGSTSVTSGLYRLNTTTGASTFIGLTGASDITGAGFSEGTFYAFTDIGRQILSINTASGSATAVSNYSGTTGAIWGAVATPEPSTFTLFAFGLALVGIACLRKIEE